MLLRSDGAAGVATYPWGRDGWVAALGTKSGHGVPRNLYLHLLARARLVGAHGGA